MRPIPSSRLTRRVVVHGLASVAALTALSACTPAPPPTPTPAPAPAKAPAAPATAPPAPAPTATAAPKPAAPTVPAPTPTPQPVPAAKPAAKAEPFKMVVAAHWPLDTSSGWTGVVAEFTKRHPETTIATQNVPYGEYDVKLLAQVAAGTAPDAMAVGALWNWSLVKRGVLAELNPHMAANKASADDYFKAYVEERTFDGKLYSIPYDLQPDCVVYYDKKMFAAAGVKVPSREYTWTDFRAMARQLTKVGSDGKVSQYGAVMAWHHVLYPYAGGYVDIAVNPGKSAMDSPAAQEGFQLLLDMIYKDQSHPSPQGLQGMGIGSMDLFGTGKVAMLLISWWPIVVLPDTFKKVDLRAFVQPAGPGGKRAHQIHNTSFGASKTSKRIELAAEFVILMLGKTGWELAWKAAKGNIFPPAHKAAYEEWQKYPEGPVKESRDINGFGAQYGVFKPRHPRWTEIETKFVNPEIDLVLRDKKPMAETLKAVAQKVTEELKKS